MLEKTASWQDYDSDSELEMRVGLRVTKKIP